jgi:hypothetical protein
VESLQTTRSTPDLNLEEFGWVERLGQGENRGGGGHGDGAGVGEEEKGGNYWGGLPHEFK